MDHKIISIAQVYEKGENPQSQRVQNRSVEYGCYNIQAKAKVTLECVGKIYEGKSEEIPLKSKIISVADIYDALTTDRPYRKAMTNRQAIDIIKEESGQKLDPFVVEKFLVLYDKGRFKI